MTFQRLLISWYTGFGKNHGFQVKTTDLGLNRCENTFSLKNSESGAKRGWLFRFKFVDVGLWIYLFFFG